MRVLYCGNGKLKMLHLLKVLILVLLGVIALSILHLDCHGSTTNLELQKLLQQMADSLWCLECRFLIVVFVMTV